MSIFLLLLLLKTKKKRDKRKAKQKNTFSPFPYSPHAALHPLPTLSLFFIKHAHPLQFAHPLPIPTTTTPLEKITERQGGMEQLHREKRNSSYKNAAFHTLKGERNQSRKKKSDFHLHFWS